MILRLHWLRWLKIPLLTVLGCLLVLAACQGFLIYPAPRYPAQMQEHLPREVTPLPCTTDQGAQTSWLLTQGDPRQVQTWWVAFGGNGMAALQWCDLLAPRLSRGEGFLLVDYPGYGLNEGSCTPGRLLRASEAAVAALAARLGTTPEDLGPRLSLLGHSLGAAVALQHAAAHPPRRLVLCAPFTSMVAMGHRALFWPCGQLIWHRFDNRDRLDDLARLPTPPSVLILHGTDDRLIPPTMGRELAAAHPAFVTFVEVPGADHNSLLEAVPDRL